MGTCIVCDELIGEKRFIRCEGCNRNVHLDCISLSSTEIRSIELKGPRKLKYFCEGCEQGLALIPVLSAKVEELIKEIKSLKEDVSKLQRIHETIGENESVKRLSYGEVVKSTDKAESVLILEVRGEKRNKQEIIKDLKDNIDPVDLEIGVSVGNVTKKGGIIIQCEDEKSLRKMESSIQKNMNEHYTVKIPGKINPRIKVLNIGEEDKGEDIITRIINQNRIDNKRENFLLELKYETKVRKDVFNMILETDVETFKKIMEEQVLRIGWKRCKVVEHITVLRCFNCCKFGHLAKDCKNNRICPKCAGSHEE